MMKMVGISASHPSTTTTTTTTTTTPATVLDQHNHSHHSVAPLPNPNNIPVVLRPSKGTNKSPQPPSSREEDKEQLIETRKRARNGQPILRHASNTSKSLMKHTSTVAKGQQQLSFTNGVLGINNNGNHGRLAPLPPPPVPPVQHIDPPLEQDAQAAANDTRKEDKKKGEEARSLRSKAGGSRLKSDLAIYFANFDDVIAGVPQSPEYVGIDEAILITDVEIPSSTIPPATQTALNISTPSNKTTSQTPNFSPLDILSLTDVPISVDINSPDPLDETLYLASHKRAERREKQLRNIEKERAQHEKGQLETLLDSLQGPDWLKVMGVTGVTDGARKEFEPKRDYFVKEVRALLNKFRVWKEAEKKLLQDKAAREDEDDVEGEDQDEDDVMSSDLNSSDADAWAARQLRQEAKSANKPPKFQRLKIRVNLPPKPPEPPKPFTSFFDKPHLRTAALSKHRSGRRTVLAFGHPVPEVLEEIEFELGDDLLTPEVLKAQARKRRRMNREQKDSSKEKSDV